MDDPCEDLRHQTDRFFEEQGALCEQTIERGAVDVLHEQAGLTIVV
jgi:hypothetical protein